MNILKNINVARRFIMRNLTKNIGQSRVDPKASLTAATEIKRVLICRPNHRLGNLLLITPLLQEVTATFPDCKIDLFVKGSLAPTLFQNYKNIHRIIELPRKPFKNLFQYIKGWIAIKSNQYDIVINVAKHSSSGRLSAQFANSKYKFFGNLPEDDASEHTDQAHIAKYPIYSFRKYLSQLGLRKNYNAVASLNLKLSLSEIADGHLLLKEMVNPEQKTISIFTYATGDKCYSESWWEHFYEQLKISYPGYNIIEILPVENVSKIGFKAPTFYSTNIRQIGALIANTDLFIGADSGIMHLASAVHTPTIGLFSVTDHHTYQPYNNNSIAINTNNSTIKDWISALNGVLVPG